MIATIVLLFLIVLTALLSWLVAATLDEQIAALSDRIDALEAQLAEHEAERGEL